MTHDEMVERLSRTAALTFVCARAFRLYNERLEHYARQLRQVHTQETKQALRLIEDGCKKADIGLQHFEDWALSAGVTESGHTGDAEALEAYLNDSAWVAFLAGATFNAAANDPTIRLQIESLCKIKTTGKPLIDWSILEGLKPTLS